MNMPIIVRLATKADLSNRSAAVALRDFEPLMTAVDQTRPSGDVGSMSGLPPKAVMRQTCRISWFVLTAESCTATIMCTGCGDLLDHLVGAVEQSGWRKAERLPRRAFLVAPSWL
jgi:hypothetical protein